MEDPIDHLDEYDLKLEREWLTPMKPEDCNKLNPQMEGALQRALREAQVEIRKIEETRMRKRHEAEMMAQNKPHTTGSHDGGNTNASTKTGARRIGL